MTVLSCTNTICRTLTIPTPSQGFLNVPTTVTIDVPQGLNIASAAPSTGTVVGNVWTVPQIAAGTSPSLRVCFALIDCNGPAPAAKAGKATIATTINETNYTNNVLNFELDYITCQEIGGCGDTDTLVAHDCYTEAANVSTADNLDTSSAGILNTAPVNTNTVMSYTSPTDATLSGITITGEFDDGNTQAGTVTLQIFEGLGAAAPLVQSVPLAISGGLQNLSFVFPSTQLKTNQQYIVRAVPNGLVVRVDATDTTYRHLYVPTNQLSTGSVNARFDLAGSTSRKINVFTTLGDDGTETKYAVRDDDFSIRPDISKGIPSNWEPCTQPTGVSSQADNDLTLGADGLPYYKAPAVATRNPLTTIQTPRLTGSDVAVAGLTTSSEIYIAAREGLEMDPSTYTLAAGKIILSAGEEANDEAFLVRFR